MDIPKDLSKNKNSFTLINDQNKNKIILTLENKNNSLIILAKDDSLLDCKEFILSLNFFSLYKIHKLFKMFETIDELIEFISQLIQNKETKIYSSEKGELILELNISIGIKKEIIKINLHKRDLNLEDTVFQLTRKIEEMQKEIDNLKLAVYGNPNKEKKEIDFGEIVKNENEKQFLINEIEKTLNSKIKSAKVIFSTKKDGDEPSAFHLKCDHKYNTLTLIEADNSRRFGGFANLPWCSADIYKDDKKCFLFSLDYMETYQYKNDGKAVHSCKDYGPSFGWAHDININKNSLTGKNCYTGQGSFNYNKKSNTLSGVDGYVKLNIYEVIEIIV